MTDKIKSTGIYHDVKSLIAGARTRVAMAVNEELSMLYWHIGKRINGEILQEKRAEYGKEVVARLSRDLTAEFGKGWSEKQLRNVNEISWSFGEVIS